ncbi:helix-turn-helix domain-containing protein [Microbacterium sp. SA39]|uniref:helix-turn-helix domain-containing protein n=1 Tax=Microbacterium sp. SA39 TaxID=1263625 RepID=UPI00061FCC0A|nr:helix-turn-helix domain-containing protein [Microbacterium sp. SA39]KJQ54152.1 Helix-turn-helix domain protein [Microbacterium sp. SA39]
MTVTPRIGTVADAAREYDVAPSTIRHWIHTGKIKAQRIGQRRYAVDLDSAAVDLDTAPADPRRGAFALALQAITPEDTAAMEDLAGRLSAALEGSPLPFWMAWDALGIHARHSANRHRELAHA